MEENYWDYCEDAVIPPIVELSTLELQIKEQTDASHISELFAIDSDSFRDKVLEWALFGYPDTYVVATYEFGIPKVCSDRVSRNPADYINFCLGHDIMEDVTITNMKLKGMAIGFRVLVGKLELVIFKQ
jgi:hypothetical protein